MDLAYGDADTAFRDEVRAFLADKLTPDLIAAADRTVETYSEFDYGRRWLKMLAERGWGQPGWPVEWGGTGWSAVQHYIFSREVALAGAPNGFNNHPGSCILSFGSDAQKARFLPDILKVNTIWAQGYSEPTAGVRPGLAGHLRGLPMAPTTSSTAPRYGPPLRTTQTGCSAWCARPGRAASSRASPSC